jgi:hypothetical protein
MVDVAQRSVVVPALKMPIGLSDWDAGFSASAHRADLATCDGACDGRNPSSSRESLLRSQWIQLRKIQHSQSRMGWDVQG